MSLEALLMTEPPCTLYKQSMSGRTDAMALPIDDKNKVGTVIGRLKRQSARQAAVWASLGVEADYEFLTQTGEIENGMFLVSADGRTFRVVGTGNQYYVKNGIPSHWDFALKEMRRR